MKVIIVGGGACGASCATRLRRLDESCEITILERTNEVSIANCGLPYYCSNVINDRDRILVSNPKKFKDSFNIDVRLNTEVVEINRKEKYVLSSTGEKFDYDKLVLAQGGNPIIPKLNGIDRQNIFTVRTLKDADKQLIETINTDQLRERVKDEMNIMIQSNEVDEKLPPNFCSWVERFHYEYLPEIIPVTSLQEIQILFYCH